MGASRGIRRNRHSTVCPLCAAIDAIVPTHDFRHPLCRPATTTARPSIMLPSLQPQAPCRLGSWDPHRRLIRPNRLRSQPAQKPKILTTIRLKLGDSASTSTNATGSASTSGPSAGMSSAERMKCGHATLMTAVMVALYRCRFGVKKVHEFCVVLQVGGRSI
jgi:hypothetical protein